MHPWIHFASGGTEMSLRRAQAGLRHIVAQRHLRVTGEKIMATQKMVKKTEKFLVRQRTGELAGASTFGRLTGGLVNM